MVQGLPYVDLDYCMYGRPFKKRTRIWTNAQYTPRPPCNHKTHPKTAQKGPSKRQNQLIEGDNLSLDELHALPEELTIEILNVSIANILASYSLNAQAGHEVLTLDMDPKSNADIICDILEWDYTNFSLQDPDVIWCSPPCTQYSIARTKAKTPRDLDGADAIVQRCLDIIAYWKPKVYFIENPEKHRF